MINHILNYIWFYNAMIWGGCFALWVQIKIDYDCWVIPLTHSCL